MKKAPIWELSFFCAMQNVNKGRVWCQRLGKCFGWGRRDWARRGAERLHRRCLESGGRAPAAFAFRALLVLALSLSFCAPCFSLIPGVGLEERFGCWRAVGIGVVAVIVFGFGAAEGVVFERGLVAGACGFERGVCVCCGTATDQAVVSGRSVVGGFSLLPAFENRLAAPRAPCRRRQKHTASRGQVWKRSWSRFRAPSGRAQPLCRFEPKGRSARRLQ